MFNTLKHFFIDLPLMFNLHNLYIYIYIYIVKMYYYYLFIYLFLIFIYTFFGLLAVL